MVAKADYSQKIVKPIFWNNICLTSILQKSYLLVRYYTISGAILQQKYKKDIN